MQRAKRTIVKKTNTATTSKAANAKIRAKRNYKTKAANSAGTSRVNANKAPIETEVTTEVGVLNEMISDDDHVNTGNNVGTISELRSDVDLAVTQIQRQSDWLKSIRVEDENLEMMKTRLEIVVSAWEKFEFKFGMLQRQGQDQSLRDMDMALHERVEDTYVEVRSALRQRIAALEPCTSSVGESNVHESGNMQLQFADLPLADRLPTFRGEHNEWIQFRDTFDAEVLRNPHLTNLQRLRRLQSCVKDGAARALGFWPQREESFIKAWETLCSSFDNEYLCHAAHCAAIFDLPIWPRANYSLIRSMLDTTRNSMRMLAQQLSPDEQRDLIVLKFLESRLDSVSRSQWEMVRPTERIPCLQKDFFAWLERRSSGLLGCGLNQGAYNALGNSENRMVNVPLRERPRPNMPQTINNYPCFSCGGNHGIHRCPNILRMSRNDRVQRINELGLCHNCLRRGHIARNCFKNKCLRCSQAHNSILCPKIFLTSSFKPSGSEPNRAMMPITTDENNKNQTDHYLDQLIQKFFETETFPSDNSQWTAEQQQCETHFLETHRFDPDQGRYVLKIPLRPDWCRIGSNRGIALQRFLRLESRLKREHDLSKKYHAFFNEYIEKDWLRPATKSPEGPAYYIPHHAVLKKFRVVFDASCLTDTGISLNDVQMIGPKLQKDLIDLIWGFRLNAYGVSADIKQMFPQVKIEPEHWDLQRIFWRDDTGNISEYWLTGVTFGMASAPFCAVRAMQQCARDNACRWPLGAKAVLNNFYMDDCLAGADTEEELFHLCQEMRKLLLLGGFELTKWQSNSESIQLSLDPEHVSGEAELNANTETSVLGLRWDTQTDELFFKVQSLPTIPLSGWTKRLVLSVTARLYDPDGLVSPFVVKAKILIQRVWETKLSWDAILPEVLNSEWQDIFSQILDFERIRIPRWLGFECRLRVSLHGFADASIQAYGAVIYMVIEKDSKVMSNLILAKSRVAPLKKESIPRLELRAAALLSELMRRVLADCEVEHKMKIVSSTCWSDSMVVLCWLKRETGSLKQFVANRVHKIKEHTLTCDWRYVPTAHNPADVISRGAAINELVLCELWWNGPTFLQQPKFAWPSTPDNLPETFNEEVRSECRRTFNDKAPTETLQTVIAAGARMFPWQKSCQIQLVASVNPMTIDQQSLLYRYSSITRLIRVTAWVLRFTRYCRMPSTERDKTPLSVKDLDESLNLWIQQEQLDHFKEDIRLLQLKNRSNQAEEKPRISNAIGMLSPFIQDGILRMHGRLQNADLLPDQCNPIILPRKGRLAWLLARMTHLQLFHCGSQQLIAVLRQRYWIIGIRSLARTLIRDCIVCEKLKAKISEQMMGDLPKCRVRPARPFLHAGVDYAGPIHVRPDRRRGNVIIKGYIAVFVCMVSKAVHLEFVSDLTTNAFLMAFIRFTSRYGHCLHLWSDNGTNFVGAERELSHMLQTWQSSDLFEQLAIRHTQWHFITPSAPHQGGLWEAAVKAVKHHLRRVMGKRLLTVEAIQTLLAEIGAILNSRPLCAQSADPQDLNPLTPGHLLIGESLIPALGEQVPMDRPENTLSYWQARQQMTQRFWKLWSESYLHELQQRPKWRAAQQNLKVGDLVVIKSENTPPSLWKMARITELHPGSDNLVRNVTLWTGNNFLSRPIQKLCVLPVEHVEPRESSSLKAGGCSSD